MLDDFKVIAKDFSNGKDIHIYPISDVHLGAQEHLQKEWLEFIQVIQSDPDGYAVLVGDLINNSTRSSIANVYEETMRPQLQKTRMVEMLTPIRDKILCAVSGNHERRSLKDADDDAMYDIMCKLDLEEVYRPNACFVKINFGRNQKIDGKRRPCYTLCITHGAGSGYNRAEKFSYYIDNLDCLITGHTHKPVVMSPAKIMFDTHNNRISIKPFKVVTATSWLNYGGYAMQKLLQPATMSPQVLTLCADHKEIKVTM